MVLYTAASTTNEVISDGLLARSLVLDVPFIVVKTTRAISTSALVAITTSDGVIPTTLRCAIKFVHVSVVMPVEVAFGTEGGSTVEHARELARHVCMRLIVDNSAGRPGVARRR